ncbi:MAG: DUF2461 domain-containing protein [Flavobacteriaceae bacterium]|nr:DUF2461 domain-containing protein [Flavobacteriaceae bacterium]
MQNINQEIFTFLNQLKLNNNRDWFEDNRQRFKNIQNEIEILSTRIVDELNKHDNVENFKIFRIYRDLRFLKNKVPYKINFGISFKRISPSLRGGYYLHIKPNDTFIACGFFKPNKEDLLRIRREFEFNSNEFREIINEKSIKKNWGNIDGNPVKTNPRGFSKEHSNIDLIRMKRYLFFKKYRDNSVFSSNFINNISHDFMSMRPFLDYMSNVLTTDLNGLSVLQNDL